MSRIGRGAVDLWDFKPGNAVHEFELPDRLVDLCVALCRACVLGGVPRVPLHGYAVRFTLGYIVTALTGLRTSPGQPSPWTTIPA